MFAKIPLPIKKLIYSSLFETPPLYIPRQLPNKLGLQTLRTFLFNIQPLRLFASTKSIPEFDGYVNELKEKGYVVIPNFLDENLAEQVRSEYKKLEPTFRSFAKDDQRPKRSKLFVYHPNKFLLEPGLTPGCEKAFIDNPILDYIVSKVGKSPLGITPNIIMYKAWYEKEDLGKKNSFDPSSNFHADVTYPSIKAWYYIDDTDADQGATIYSDGSHKITRGRLHYDHFMSVVRGNSKQEYRQLESEENIRDFIDITETPLIGKANTLALFDVCGFHKRGQFNSLKPRNTIHLDFRLQKSLLNTLFLSKKIKHYFTKKA